MIRQSAERVTDLNLIASHADAAAVLEEATLAYGGLTEGYSLAANTSTCARLLTCDAPVAALYVCDRIANGGKMQVTPSLIGVGVDLQFRFGRPFRIVGDDPASLDCIRDAIVTCHVGLQVIGRRSGHGTPLNTWTALADFGLAAYHVRGEAIAIGTRLISAPFRLYSKWTDTKSPGVTEEARSAIRLQR